MNAKRRKVLKYSLTLMSDVTTMLEKVLDEEQDSIENVPESLQSGELYDKMENAIESLEEALDGLEDVQSFVEAALV